MKDKDFDDIGKRLYDLEADPPKNGWSKVGSALNAPAHSGKIVWLRKNWWKPLVVLIPVGFYMLYSVDKGGDPSMNLASKMDSTVEQSSKKADTDVFNSKKGSTKTEGAITDKVNEPFEEKSAQKIPDKPNDPINQILTPAESNLSGTRSSAEVSANADHEKAKFDLEVTNKNKADDANPLDNTKDPNVSNDLSHRSEMSDARLPKLSAKPGETISSEDQGIQIPENMASSPVAVGPTIDTKDESFTDPTNPSLLADQQNQYAPSGIDTTNTEKKTDPSSTKLEEIVSDSLASESEEEASEKAIGSRWRLTFSLTPQYVSRSIRPVANDDVLVTGIDRSRDSRKIGLGFALGLGKAITENLYIDAQVSYAEAKQDIHISYATGKVDTLLAVQQADQSVRVIPVYEIANREISSKYGYAGIKLGATHYFWSTARRRFNLSAMAGAHYLISADVKEQLNGRWVKLTSDDLNKMNYTVMVGVGYNIHFSRGWELMINPAITYYLRKVKNSELPYNLNQQSIGLNFMFSKTLGLR